ncbi:MAG: type II toxin-antitoxin system HicB family antitoxin [Verrucomicrobiota bacterium]
MKTINRYLTRIHWSDDDEAYIAEVPALPGCVAHGATMQKAARELEKAFALWTESATRHGDTIPEPDLAREEIERFAPVLSVAKLARRAGINQHTLASKLRRKSPFTKEETSALLKAFA